MYILLMVLGARLSGRLAFLRLAVLSVACKRHVPLHGAVMHFMHFMPIAWLFLPGSFFYSLQCIWKLLIGFDLSLSVIVHMYPQSL